MKVAQHYILFSFSSLVLVLSPLNSNPQSAPQYILEINSNGITARLDSLGHAFMVIKVKTSSGYKEEAFGFYSDPEVKGITDPNFPRLIVGMPGALEKEFDRHPERFSKVDETVEIPITAEQRREIYHVAEVWDHHQYELLTDNCIEFVSKVVEKTGVPLPSRAQYPTADKYVAALRKNNEQEQVRREAEARREAEEEARKKAEEEANRIPPGWVACHCPEQHAPYGKFVGGVLYHPNNIGCK
jgi:hypothetical protein